MAYKTWAVGDILTAADMNAMVRDQTITICTSNTRPTGAVAGHFIYETDTGMVRVSDGTGGWALLSMKNPPSWEMMGGGGLALPTAPGSTQYAASVTIESVGLAAYSRTPAQVTIAIPGKYDMAFGGRIDATTTMDPGIREFRVEVVRGGSTYRNFTQQSEIQAVTGRFADGNLKTVVDTDGTAHRVGTGPVRLNQGDVVKAWIRQTHGLTLHLNESISECHFTGLWVGP